VGVFKGMYAIQGHSFNMLQTDLCTCWSIIQKCVFIIAFTRYHRFSKANISVLYTHT